MAEHPILIFPTAVEDQRDNAGGGGRGVVRPSPSQQHGRLTQKFESIVSGFEALEASAEGFDPERVVVFEVAGSLTDVARRAREIPGLEWLEELDADDIEPVAGFEHPKDAARRLPARLFAVMSNQRAINDLIGLWQQWPTDWESSGDDMVRVEKGFGPFKDLFRHLVDIRHWGPKDRVQDTILPWIDRLEIHGERLIKFEAELWFRQDVARRSAAEASVAKLLGEAGGRQVSSCVIPEIRYHGLLLEAPASALQDLSRQIAESDHGGLIRCEDVMFFRPGPQSVSAIVEVEAPDEAVKTRPAPSVSEPTVAILDGLPLERHAALDGRLIIDDPDDVARKYRPGQQQHGTAMASLILHGDLEDEQAEALDRPVYVRPVLEPVEVMPGVFHEQFPENRLFIDVIHRAVRRLYEGDGEELAVAPSVRIINLSLGNPWQRFDRQLSPLAKLLDWLSSKYNVLFLVAAGNQPQTIEVSGTWDEFRDGDDAACAIAVLRAMGGDQLQRRLYSPAESVNALTVGALHEDLCDEAAGGVAIDLLRGSRLVSPLGPVASGFRRSVKPEVLMPGGKQLYTRRLGDNNGVLAFDVAPGKRRPGQKVAAPGTTAGELTKYWYERGTSNATALATRAAATILDRLLVLRDEAEGSALNDESLHVATKALLVHGCAWGDLEGIIATLAPDESSWEKRRRLIAHYLGYGAADLDRSIFATDQRVLLLGCADIAAEEGHIYTLPLPSALSGLKNRRRLTATLAWTTPVNSLHRDYRRAALFLKVQGDSGGFDSTDEVHDQLSGVGTVQHVMYSTERAVPIDEDSGLELKVNCRPAAGRLDGTVPYALAVTLELADPIETSIYQQIRDAIRTRARVR
ncbi:MAG: S8 family peptidase [Phycisphaerales bacterium JB038]